MPGALPGAAARWSTSGVRRLLLALVVALLAGVGLLAAPGADAAAADEQVEIDLYGLSTCPHCRAARAFLEDLSAEVPEVRYRYHDLSGDPAAQREYAQVVESRGGTTGAVPAIVLGERLWIGFSDSTMG